MYFEDYTDPLTFVRKTDLRAYKLELANFINVDTNDSKLLRERIFNYYIINEELKKLSMKKIKYFSPQSLDNIKNDIINKLKTLENYEPPYYVGAKNNSLIFILYHKLTRKQKTIFNLFNQTIADSLLSENLIICSPKIILLDSSPGVGKTYLMNTFLNGTLLSKMIIADKKDVLTNYEIDEQKSICKFIMDTFKLNYDEAITIFVNKNTKDEVKTVFDFLLKKKPIIPNILVVDEYLNSSPLFLALLIILSKKLLFNLILIGDKNQQSTISITKTHQQSSFSLVNNISLHVEKFILYDQNRIKDYKLINIIKIIKTWLEKQTQLTDNYDVKNCFIFKYLVFEHLVEKFVSKEDVLNTCYLADTHRKLRERVFLIEKKAKEEKRKIFRTPFYIKDKNTDQTRPLVVLDNAKFLPFILLVVNTKYEYFHNNEFCIVTLMNIEKDYLEILLGKDIIKIYPCRWVERYNLCVSEKFTWLKSFYDNEKFDLFQYHLKPMLHTYYSVQGKTLSDVKISFTLDCSNCNAIYVALSRINYLDQINRIYTKDLPHLLFTKYMNDNYYYKTSNSSNNFNKALLLNCVSNKQLTVPINKIKTIENKKSFISKQGFCRILKENLEEIEIVNREKSILNEIIEEYVAN